MSNRAILVLAAAALCGADPASAAEPYADIAAGPFKPDWASLQSQYRTPDWFRDAKFGIWAHWGPQCQPEHGDWYARNMYVPSHADYKFHVERYGPPSKFGFKDVIHEWKAERFDPEKLLALYKKAGAKYFVALANHHDNFDNFDSRYQPWNAVALGPKKDLVGLWAKAARAAGMRFGVSVHASHAWSWYEPSQGADVEGPLKGVPYDGRLTRADGKGQWWEGLDPQDLYAQNHAPGKKLVWTWDPAEGSSVPDPAYCAKFFLRTKQLVDDYKPDLLYFDDTVLPLGFNPAIGLGLAAHFYNASTKWHGQNEAVMNTKKLDPEQRTALVYDIERGKTQGIEPYPWQTDTCIGSWHYNRGTYEKHTYKTAAQVIPMLVDIVSKNGNLLLSIPVRGDGTIDEDEEKFLGEMAAWIAVNGDAIYGTRPWRSFGEGPSAEETPAAGRHGGVSDTRNKPYTAADYRFTTKGGALYAIALGWPADGRLKIRALAAGKGEVKQVALLGATTAPEWKQTPDGLEVTLPSQPPCAYAYALKVTGGGLAP
jgi:alpha-L-fucosidase